MTAPAAVRPTPNCRANSGIAGAEYADFARQSAGWVGRHQPIVPAGRAEPAASVVSVAVRAGAGTGTDSDVGAGADLPGQYSERRVTTAGLRLRRLGGFRDGDLRIRDVGIRDVRIRDLRHHIPDRLPPPAHPVRVDPHDRPVAPPPPGPGSEGTQPVAPAADP